MKKENQKVSSVRAFFGWAAVGRVNNILDQFGASGLLVTWTWTDKLYGFMFILIFSGAFSFYILKQVSSYLRRYVQEDTAALFHCEAPEASPDFSSAGGWVDPDYIFTIWVNSSFN